MIADDVGAALKVKVAFTDDKDNPESAESALTAVVTVAQVVVSFGPGPYAAQEGGSVRVRVALDKNPHRTVTIPLIATPQGGADPGDYAAPTEVVFNAGQTSKDVTVTAVDDSVDDDGESVEVTFGRLPDGVSEGATTQAAVRITDNDGRGIDLSSPSLTVTEGGSATYMVALASRPTATVTVAITGHLGTDVSLNTTLLFFTTSDWETAQTVMVSATQDLDANNDSVTLTHTATGADYAGVTATVAVTVVDDDRRPAPPIGGGGGGGGGGSGGGGSGGGAPLNRSPEFTDGFTTDRSIAENTPAGADIGEPVAARDREDDTLTYSLRGVDADAFDIDPATGQLLTKAPLDYEAQAGYSVIVSVSDGKGSSGRESDAGDDSITVTINVENVDEPDAVFADAPNGVFERSVAENTGEGEAVGAPVAATSPSDGALTYALGGADAALFAVDAGTGQIRVGAGTALDYEADRNVYEVTVAATDSSGVSATVAVTIRVTDVDLGPYDMDKNEVIDRDEALEAVVDYFADRITKEEAIAVVQLYFAG